MTEFMQRQITNKQNWLRVETTSWTEFIDSASLGLFVRNSEQVAQPLTEDERDEYLGMIRDYCEGEPQSWENIQGYGVRLSAPGYMDCTEWCVFDSVAEAEEYLIEMYGDEEEEEEEEEED